MEAASGEIVESVGPCQPCSENAVKRQVIDIFREHIGEDAFIAKEHFRMYTDCVYGESCTQYTIEYIDIVGGLDVTVGGNHYDPHEAITFMNCIINELGMHE